MTDDLVKRLRHGTAGDKERHAAADRIEILENALLTIAKINNRRDRFSSEIDAVIVNVLEEDK